MNNHGFAITGMLYTLFALFFIIMTLILANLSVKKNMLEKSVEVLEKEYEGTKITDLTSVYSIDSANNSFNANVSGKYIFTLYSGSESWTCTSYMKKGTSIRASEVGSNKNFIPSNCNEYTFSFQENSNIVLGNKMVLEAVYQF